MHSKVYWITCDPEHADGLLQHYETSIIPAVKSSEHHVGHHMIDCGSGKWLLVSNYHNQDAADAAVSLVQELIKPMVENFGMKLEPITEGKVNHSY